MADQKINEEQIKFYNENGYLIVNNVLSNLECDKYLKQIKKHANIDFAAIMNPDRFDFLIAQTFENLIVGLSISERVDMVSNCKVTSKMTFNIMSNKIALNILETLQKRKVVGLMSQMLFKEAYILDMQVRRGILIRIIFILKIILNYQMALQLNI